MSDNRKTREIKPLDRGTRTATLDLDLVFDPITKTYSRSNK